MGAKNLTTALCLEQVDGNLHMLRGDLHLVLFHVLDRSPTAEELDVFLTFFDTDTSAVISRAEFDRSISRMKGAPVLLLHPAAADVNAPSSLC